MGGGHASGAGASIATGTMRFSSTRVAATHTKDRVAGEQRNMGMAVWGSLGIACEKPRKTSLPAVERCHPDSGYKLTGNPLAVDRPWSEMHESNQPPNNYYKKILSRIPEKMVGKPRAWGQSHFLRF